MQNNIQEAIFESANWYTLKDLKKMNKRNTSSNLSKDKSLNKIYSFKFSKRFFLSKNTMQHSKDCLSQFTRRL
jgi:FPC/CPF motif-containing protein YcgG